MDEVVKQQLIAQFFKEVDTLSRGNDTVWTLLFMRKLNDFIDFIYMEARNEGFLEGLREGKKISERERSKLN